MWKDFANNVVLSFVIFPSISVGCNFCLLFIIYCWHNITMFCWLWMSAGNSYANENKRYHGDIFLVSGGTGGCLLITTYVAANDDKICIMKFWLKRFVRVVHESFAYDPCYEWQTVFELSQLFCFVSDLLYLHWNGNVVILWKSSSLAVLKVVILTTFSAASDENFVKMTTFSFQCMSKCQSLCPGFIELWY